MYRNCPQYPMPYQGPEMQYPFLGMEYPYYPGLEMQYPYMGQGMQYPFYPCPGHGPMPCPPMPMPPGPGMDYPPVEIQRIVREMLEMVRAIYQEECQ
ncbi:MAG: hypothetical protein VR72_07270 [Clostridiaceae bacterium BRH_c20a]|nr:MAG: hypothetical protein VR72_07270 [Clostridiaceae bacterium BRH_c20a]